MPSRLCTETRAKLGMALLAVPFQLAFDRTCSAHPGFVVRDDGQDIRPLAALRSAGLLGLLRAEKPTFSGSPGVSP